MTKEQVHERLGGADSGSPVGVREPGKKRPPVELHIEMLPQPGIFSRLRGSFSAAAILPAFDPRSLRTREWRAAAALTLAGHVLFVGLIAWLGWRTLTAPADEVTQIRMVSAGEFTTDQPDAPGDSSAAQQGDAGGPSS